MDGMIDTYFEAWNETDDAARRALTERCLAGDVVLIEEHGRFSGHDGLEALMANSNKPFRVAESSRRAASTSSTESPATRGTPLMPTAHRFGRS